ncbi:MAG: hypothetical protein DHS20C14_10050 [Phycisphaeraceae bacterium]|nr:MAG: hypothetical protein DHS20C14_10050 [Phycisphaeraceae bacterium]
MAIFGKKNKESDAETPGAATTDGTTIGDAAEAAGGFSPQKARAFFDRAKTLHETASHEYAMQMWLSGLRWDPTSVEGFDGFLKSSDVFVADNPKKKIKPTVEAKGAVGRYIDALMAFGLRKLDPAAALKACSAASDVGVREVAKRIGKHALTLALNHDKKPKKDAFVKLLDVLEKAEDFQSAAQAGEAACKLDPSDGELQARVRNMMARATMNRGGFEDDSEGGFARNVRNMDKQLELEQADSYAKTGATKDAIITRTRTAHEENPDDMPTLEAYGKALVERGKPADYLKAMSLYTQAHKTTGQFRFRQRSGEIKIRLTKRTALQLKQAAEANPDDTAARDKYAAALKTLREQELEELRLQVENYPTDLPLKFELGKRYFEREEYNEAIEQFQQAQNDAKLRRQVQNMMGQALLKLGGWEAEAVQTFRSALDGLSDLEGETGMELRYGLMVALQAFADKDRDLDAAKEAEKIAGGIAIKSFTYRDIRERRDAIKALVKELGGG